MSELSPTSQQVLISGGFRIEISPDSLTVIKIPSRNSPRSPISVIRTALYCVLFFCAFGILVVAIRQYPFPLLITLSVIVFIYAFTRTRNLRCTKDRLEIIDTFNIRPPHITSYPRSEVKSIRYCAVAYSKYGAKFGLSIKVAGAQINALAGLRVEEGTKILEMLEKLGYTISN